jgi:threonine synthase
VLHLFDAFEHVVTLREGNTPLPAGVAFHHQGDNPTGRFKDNGMTCNASA